jgi:hypothetical protein
VARIQWPESANRSLFFNASTAQILLIISFLPSTATRHLLLHPPTVYLPGSMNALNASYPLTTPIAGALR